MSYLTEEQAAEKWCPEVRRAPGGDNADADGGRRTPKCIGSACMMWRWHVETLDASGLPVPPDHRFDRIKAGDKLTSAWGKTGYCGLAGNPG